MINLIMIIQSSQITINVSLNTNNKKVINKLYVPQWVLEERKGSWTKGITDGGCVNFKDTFLAKNHHYQFEILEADDETVQVGVFIGVGAIT